MVSPQRTDGTFNLVLLYCIISIINFAVFIRCGHIVKFSTCDPMGVPVVLSWRILVFQIDDAAFKFVKCFFTFHLYFLWWEFPEWVLNKAVKGSGKPGCSSISVSSDVVSVSLFPRLVSTAASRSTTFISRMSSSVNSDDWSIRIHNYYYAEYLKKYIKYILWSLIIFVQTSWSRALKHKLYTTLSSQSKESKLRNK